MMDNIAQQALHTINKYQMIRHGDSVLVALSGGADSLCLLHVLKQLQAQMSFRLNALHIDHGLRPESSSEANLVRSLSEQLDVACEVRSVSVRQRAAETGESIQVAARILRYEVLTSMATECGANRIAVGHTADDQAETVLMNVLRGSGGTGLAGIPPTRESIIRPLIEVWREETHTYCKKKSLPYICDPSNEQNTYLRNRIRNDLIPLLEREYNPKLRNALCRLSEITRADEAYWADQSENVFFSEDLAGEIAHGMARMRAAGLNHLPLAMARRVLRYAYRRATGQIATSFERLEAALALRRPGTRGGAIIQLGGQVYAQRSGSWLEIHHTDNA